MRRHQKTHFVATATSAIALATCITPINAHDDHQNRDDITRGEAHPTIMDTTRFFTNRDGAALNLPTEDEAFTFAIFGDRTGGPADGINVLKDAVHDVNIMEPDFVMTVGDMIQGYNQTDAWMDQMREFKGVMDELLCPWFPVAGNHDIYWRGPDKPAGEHEASYEVHFGPLWYSFEHKDCHFIVLYTDEGNPDTGRKSIREPEAQRMSPEQLSWLESALEHANDAQHVFVFVHHPRWLKGNYGNDWKNVHAKLVDAGNVRAVFAGHIHRMRYDGVKDGIEYVTLATVGGHNDFSSPEAGYLHHMNLITVRPHQIAMSAIPVGEVMDVRAITGDVSDAASMLARSQPTVDDVVRIRTDGASDGRVRVTVRNPTGGTVDVAMYPDSDDARWTFVPDHQHGTINAEGEMAFDFEVQRNPGAIDDSFHPIALVQRMDYLTDDARYAIPERRIDVPHIAALPPITVPDQEQVLILDGHLDCLRVMNEQFRVPNGPLTIECWFNAESFGDRVGLIAKTEYSEYGIFVSDGRPNFSIHLDGRYAEAQSADSMLRTDVWHHIAGVYDEQEVRLYVDGQLIDTVRRAGRRTPNRLPIFIGADVDRHGQPTSFFDGAIDAVRVSTTARYDGDSFVPARRLETDDHTQILLNMDARVGPWVYDNSTNHAHALIEGDTRIQSPTR